MKVLCVTQAGQPPPKVALWTAGMPQVHSMSSPGVRALDQLTKLPSSQEGPPFRLRDPGAPWAGVGVRWGSWSSWFPSPSRRAVEPLPSGLAGACRLGTASCRWILRDMKTAKDGLQGALAFPLP